MSHEKSNKSTNKAITDNAVKTYDNVLTDKVVKNYTVVITNLSLYKTRTHEWIVVSMISWWIWRFKARIYNMHGFCSIYYTSLLCHKMIWSNPYTKIMSSAELRWWLIRVIIQYVEMLRPKLKPFWTQHIIQFYAKYKINSILPLRDFVFTRF